MKKLFWVGIVCVFLCIAFLIVFLYFNNETLIIHKNRGKSKMPITTAAAAIIVIAGAGVIAAGGVTIGIVVAVNKSEAHKIDEKFKRKELETLLDQAHVEVKKAIEALDDVTKSRKAMSDNLFTKKMLERQCYIEQDKLDEQLKKEKITTGQKVLDVIDFLDVLSSKEEKERRKNATNLQIKSIINNRKAEIEKLTNAIYGCEALHKKNIVNTKKNLCQLEELYDSAIQHIALYNEKSKNIAFKHETEVQKIAMAEAFKLLLACRDENGKLSEKLLIGFLDYVEMATNSARAMLMEQGMSVKQIAEKETNVLRDLKEKVDEKDFIEFLPSMTSNSPSKHYNSERLPLIYDKKEITKAIRYIEEKKQNLLCDPDKLSTFEALEWKVENAVDEINRKEEKKLEIEEKIKRKEGNDACIELMNTIDQPFVVDGNGF